MVKKATGWVGGIGWISVRRHVWTGVIRPGDFVSGGLVAIIIMYT